MDIKLLLKVIVVICFTLSPTITFSQNNQEILLNDGFNSFLYEDGHKLWISSQEGWNRYDGEEITTYKSNDGINGLKGNWIQSSFYKDRDGNLWSSTFEYLCYYSHSDDKFYSFQPIIGKDTISKEIRIVEYREDINAIVFRGNNRLILHDIDSKDFEYCNPEFFTFGYIYKRYTLDSVSTLIASPWILGNFIEIWNYKGKQYFKEVIDFRLCNSSFRNIQVSDILIDDENIWLISNIGLVLLNIDSPCNSKIFLSEKSKFVLKKGLIFEGHILISNYKDGLELFSINDRKIVARINSQSSYFPLISSEPFELAMSKNDVWVTHRSKGIQRIPKTSIRANLKIGSNIQSIDNPLEVVSNECHLAIRSNSDLIFSNRYSESSKLDVVVCPEKCRSFALNDSILHCISESTIWNVDLQDTNFTDIVRLDSLKLQEIISTDKVNFVIASEKLFQLNNDNTIDRFYAFENSDDIINFFFRDSTFQVATSSSTVAIWKDSVRYNINIDSYINKIYVDSDRIILGLNDGIGIIHLNTLEFKHKLIDNTEVNDILKIDSNYVFLITSRGIYKLDAKINLERLTYDNTKDCSHYNEYLYCITDSGIHVTSHSEIYRSKADSIFIKSINKPYSRIGNTYYVNYDYDEKPLNIDISSSEVLFNEKGLYQYCITNSLETCENLNMREDLNLRFLKEGEYFIEMKVLNSPSISNKILINLSINGPFWTQWWFRTLCILGLVGIGFGISYYRTRQKLKKQQIQLDRQEALQQQRNRMSQDLHDEMGSGLSAIKHLSATQSSTDKDAQIESIATTLIRSMRDLLWSLDESNDTVHNLSVKIRQTANQMLRNSTIKHKVKVSLQDEEVVVSGQDRRNIILIVKEIFNNALKHSAATKIDIDIISEGSELIIHITDNGNGFDINSPAKGYGLKSIQKRLNDINGEHSINSSATGTSIRVKLNLWSGGNMS